MQDGVNGKEKRCGSLGSPFVGAPCPLFWLSRALPVTSAYLLATPSAIFLFIFLFIFLIVGVRNVYSVAVISLLIRRHPIPPGRHAHLPRRLHPRHAHLLLLMLLLLLLSLSQRAQIAEPAMFQRLLGSDAHLRSQLQASPEQI